MDTPGRAPQLIAAGLMLGALAGTGWQLGAEAVAPRPDRIAAAGLAVLMLAVARVRAVRLGACVAGAALLALALAHHRTALRLAERVGPAWLDRPCALVGVVSGLPDRHGTALRVQVEVASVACAGEAPRPPGDGVPARVLLTLSAGWTREGEPGPAPVEPRPGERWRWSPVRLQPPDGRVNPHGRDVALHLFERGIGALARHADTPGGAVRLHDTGSYPVDRLRQRWRDRLRAEAGDTRAAGVLAALAIGDQGAIAREDWSVFARTGVSHLMAISGLHLTMFAWLASAGLVRLASRVPWLVRVWPAPAIGRWGGLLAAVAYGVVSGGGVPAQRTLAMLAVTTACRAGGRDPPAAMVLLMAASAVAALDPWALLQPGFWLSFVAVALLMASDGVSGPASRGWLAQAWRSQWVASVGLAPWTLLFFGQVSVAGLLANAVAIPVVTLAVTPLALLGGLWPPLWSAGAGLVEGLGAGLAALAAMPWAAWSAPAAPAWAQATGLAGAALAVAPLPWRLRACSGALLLPMLMPVVPRPPPGAFDLLAADIGQGHAVLVRTASRDLLYDTGPSWGRQADAGDAGEQVLVPLLRALGVSRLDRLVLSHRDSDHTGGAASVMRAVEVASVLSSLEPGHPLRLARPHQPCTAGLRWTWDGVTFEVLHPEPADLARPAAALLRPNAVSCVLRIRAGGRAALLAGDIGHEQELRLVIRRAGLLPADVLLVPHHGSGSSSGRLFLGHVRPAWSVIQAGRANRYGHPAAQTLQRLQESGSFVIQTNLCGAWHWHSADASHECARFQGRRTWQVSPPPAAAPVSPGDALRGGPEIANSPSNAPPPP